ncbi:MAG: hypothetical protein ACHQFW_04985 [Chitinophagales bacterium]
MKTWFIRTETILVFIVIIAMIMRFFHINGTDFILMVSLMTLAFLYLFMGASAKAKGFRKYSPINNSIELQEHEASIILSSGVAMSIAVIGVVFHLLHWEGSEMQLMVGAISGIICLAGCYFFLRINQPLLYGYIFFRLLPVTVMSGFLWILDERGVF